jgi:hypothetical protein
VLFVEHPYCFLKLAIVSSCLCDAEDIYYFLLCFFFIQRVKRCDYSCLLVVGVDLKTLHP